MDHKVTEYENTFERQRIIVVVNLFLNTLIFIYKVKEWCKERGGIIKFPTEVIKLVVFQYSSSDWIIYQSE